MNKVNWNNFIHFIVIVNGIQPNTTQQIVQSDIDNIMKELNIKSVNKDFR